MFNKDLTHASPERGTDVVILEDCSVVIQKRRLSARHDVKVVCCASVLIVVNEGRHQRSEDLEVCHPVLVGIQTSLQWVQLPLVRHQNKYYDIQTEKF